MSNRLEGEVLTIYDKIQEEQKKISDDMMGNHPARLVTKQAENPAVYQLLQTILDKLHAMDRYLRTELGYRSGSGRTHEGSGEEVRAAASKVIENHKVALESLAKR